MNLRELEFEKELLALMEKYNVSIDSTVNPINNLPEIRVTSKSKKNVRHDEIIEFEYEMHITEESFIGIR